MLFWYTLTLRNYKIPLQIEKAYSAVVGLIGQGSVLEIIAAAGRINIEDIYANIEVYT